MVYPDGSRDTFAQTLSTEPPYDQWFGIQVNTVTNEVKEVNFFMEADVVALLEWNTNVDLDIAVYDQYYDEFLTVHEAGGMDSIDGRNGIEVFLFGNYAASSGYDLSSGYMDILVSTYNRLTGHTNAEMRVIHSEGHVLHFHHAFSSDAKGEYMCLAAEDFDPESMTYREPVEYRIYY